MVDLLKIFVESSIVTDRVTIKLVDGRSIRQERDVDFMGGGHHWVYPFIGKKEIWIEKMKDNRECKMILVHELIERLLMRYKGMKYSSAHNIANNHEERIRNKESYQEVFKDFIDRYFGGDEDKYESLIWSYESI